MSAEEQPAVAEPVPEGVVECARHPGVQTALRCSRCDTPICPRCLVYSPVGARCPDCARVVRAPMYIVSSPDVLKALGVAIIGGLVMGILWGTVGAVFSRSWLLIFVGAALGYGFTKMMEFGTRGKRGPVIVAFAMGGIGIAWGMQLFFVPLGVFQFELLAVAVAAYLAYQNLR